MSVVPGAFVDRLSDGMRQMIITGYACMMGK